MRVVLLLSLGGGGEFGDVVNENEVGVQVNDFEDAGGKEVGERKEVERVRLRREEEVAVEKATIKSIVELHLDPKDSLFLIGGFDGKSLLATMDLYFTSQNLKNEIYVFGGGNGYVVESYNPVHDSWTLCPSLNQKKGHLLGASLNDKIFVGGDGNGVDCFSDVEMLDLDIRWWIPTRSMLDKRFSFAAMQLNGAIYATSGFDGNDYLRFAERSNLTLVSKFFVLTKTCFT
ncbi:hypothetical protein JHK84_027544 [Glycine max]|nr:hypothetical protein JHK84_027544 [Glycine max]